MNKCLCCGHKWKSRKDFPSACSLCHAKNWDIGDNAKCIICGRIILRPEVHHINGDHSDNHPENRVPICRIDHVALHANISQSKRQRKTGIRREGGIGRRHNNQNHALSRNLQQYKAILWEANR